MKTEQTQEPLNVVDPKPTQALQGWFCMLMHDYPEAEGIVWFTGAPKNGQRFKLPSSKYTEEWEVRSVNEYEMSFTAFQPNNPK